MIKKLFFYLITILTLSFFSLTSSQINEKKKEGDILDVSINIFKKHIRSISPKRKGLRYFFSNRKQEKNEISKFSKVLNHALETSDLDTVLLKNNDTFCFIQTHQTASEWIYVCLIYNDNVFEMSKDSVNSKMRIESKYKDTVPNDYYYFKRGKLDSIPNIRFYGGINGMRIIKTKKQIDSYFHKW
ncbi:MAG: hypothetical protein KF882_08430 [Bacteroidia bacterium]|nr:hypothetical protein [Bacteroidia bacterium]MCO5253542.1 hypothetical protein [Bacteroidota bacterium]